MAGNLTKLDCILMANDKASSSVLHVRNLTVGCISIVYSKRLANAGGGRQPFSDRLVPVVVIQIREYPPPRQQFSDRYSFMWAFFTKIKVVSTVKEYRDEFYV